MSAEQMQRAANHAQDAAEIIRRAASSIDELAHRLTLLFGEGYGNNVERLIEALNRDEAHRADLARVTAQLKAERNRYQRDVYGLNNEGDPIGGEPPGGFANEAAAYKGQRDALLAAIVKARADWLAWNGPRDGTDCVTPFDALLYLPASGPGEATGVSCG